MDEIKDYENRFLEAINDDLNMPVAMSVVWDVVKNPCKSQDFKNLLLKFDEVLGLNLEDVKNIHETKIEIPENVQKLVDDRNKARIDKNWAESDRIRDELVKLGYTVKDTKEGTVIQ